MNYAAIDAAREAAGHGNESCGGWMYEPSLGIVRCACGGTVPLPVEAVMGGEQSHAAALAEPEKAAA